MKKAGYIYAAIAVIGWGTMFICCKIALEVMSPMLLLFFRYAICVAVLCIIYRKVPRPKIDKKDWKYVIVIGVVGYFFVIWVQQKGTGMVDASMASLMNTLTPVLIIVFAIFILHEKSSIQQVIGIAVTVIGSMIVIGGAGSGNSLAGIAVCSGGMAGWALISVIIRKTCFKYDAIWLTIYTSIIAMLCSVPFTARELAGLISHGSMSVMQIAAVIWLGVICTAGANLWWNKSLEIMEAAKCSLFYALLPLTTALLGILILGEHLTVNFIIGGIVIIGGMIFAVASEMLPGRKDEEGE